MSGVSPITQEQFDAEVLTASTPVLVDYRADWCLPCRLVEPVLVELAAEFDTRLRFVAIDADASPDLLARYGIVALPTVQLWLDGELLTAIFGARPKAELRSTILAALA